MECWSGDREAEYLEYWNIGIMMRKWNSGLME
jgi:hypothetical protein